MIELEQIYPLNNKKNVVYLTHPDLAFLLFSNYSRA